MQLRECASIQSAEISDGILVRQVLTGDKQAFD